MHRNGRSGTLFRRLMAAIVLVAVPVLFGLVATSAAVVHRAAPMVHADAAPAPLASLHLGGASGTMRFGNQISSTGLCHGGASVSKVTASLAGAGSSARLVLHVEAVVWAGPVLEVSSKRLQLNLSFDSVYAGKTTDLTFSMSGIGTTFSGPSKVTFDAGTASACTVTRQARLTLSGTGLTLKKPPTT